MSNPQDNEAQFYAQKSYKSQEVSAAMRPKRARRIGLILLVLLLLIGGGIYALVHFSSTNAPASADGIAYFSVVDHPTIVLNGASGDIHVHANSISSMVTLRAVDTSNDTNNTAIPYTRTSNGKISTYTFDVSSFSDHTFDLAVPSLTDLQLTTTSGAITVNGVNGQMTLSASSASITINDVTLHGTSTLNENNGSLLLNHVTFAGGANILTSNGDITATNVNFHGSATVRTNNGSVTLSQDTFDDAATLTSADRALSIADTTFAGTANLTAETSGAITTTNTTFKSTALLSAVNGSISLTQTTFSAMATLSGDQGFTATQTTFNAGADVTSKSAIKFSGIIGMKGTYQMITSNGDIDLTLPTDLPFHLDATTRDGSITSDFANIHVSSSDSITTQAHGDVGNTANSSKLKFALTTDNGSIRIHQA